MIRYCLSEENSECVHICTRPLRPHIRTYVRLRQTCCASFLILALLTSPRLRPAYDSPKMIYIVGFQIIIALRARLLLASKGRKNLHTKITLECGVRGQNR